MDNLKVIYLTEDIDNKAILRILTINNTLVLEDAELRYYEQLADWANKKKTKIKNINLDTVELSDRSLIGKGISARTGSLLSTLNELNGKLSKKASSADELAIKVQRLTVEILAWFSKTKQPSRTGSEQMNRSKLHAGMDWTAEKASRLANAGGKTTSDVLDSFYNDYYKIEYAGLKSPDEEDTTGIVAKLRSLDKILTIEFNKLGYNPAVNPFAQFLKILIEHRKDLKIFDKLNTNNYGAIHNAFIDHHITGNMLGNFDNKNILFCTDLYSYKGLDIIKYLSLQKQTLNNAANNDKYSDDPKLLVSKIFMQQEQRADTFEKNIEELLKPEVTADEVNLPGANYSAKLRSISEISEIFNHIFKIMPKKELTLIEADDLGEKAEKLGIILSLFKYLLDLEKLTEQEQNDYEKWFEQFKYKHNKDDKHKSERLLSGYTLNNTAVKLMLSKLKLRIIAMNKKRADD